ncbi:uncharacterized protein MELLADRAFT_106932 [Melampsora larici-populina 98AG31]|uniref:Uncharacterized protein n=1 Tax=Melampsora larici-populina (strain 98AG31 / pathotype 3-4-7) TaxID=747676 RepID=F4RN40_MELLP|nr:uncharacterized protein MELLADRAFT_106932 [Melampsora larici-populina 98AG31]EGG06232.1 hypothetical protein MELLADRAFT_106932 [Melampsora larici-populina 98AG31]
MTSDSQDNQSIEIDVEDLQPVLIKAIIDVFIAKQTVRLQKRPRNASDAPKHPGWDQISSKSKKNNKIDATFAVEINRLTFTKFKTQLAEVANRFQPFLSSRLLTGPEANDITWDIRFRHNRKNWTIIPLEDESRWTEAYELLKKNDNSKMDVEAHVLMDNPRVAARDEATKSSLSSTLSGGNQTFQATAAYQPGLLPVEPIGPIQVEVAHLRDKYHKKTARGDGCEFTSSLGKLPLSHLRLTTWAEANINGDDEVDDEHPPKTELFSMTNASALFPPVRGETIRATPPSASTSTTAITTNRHAGPFDASDSGVITPPFEDFISRAKIDLNSVGGSKIKALGFTTWRAFEVIEGSMTSEILKNEGLDLGTRSGLLNTAKVYRQHYHDKAATGHNTT